jgi:hypothetical protein
MTDSSTTPPVPDFRAAWDPQTRQHVFINLTGARIWPGRLLNIWRDQVHLIQDGRGDWWRGYWKPRDQLYISPSGGQHVFVKLTVDQALALCIEEEILPPPADLVAAYETKQAALSFALAEKHDKQALSMKANSGDPESRLSPQEDSWVSREAEPKARQTATGLSLAATPNEVPGEAAPSRAQQKRPESLTTNDEKPPGALRSLGDQTEINSEGDARQAVPPKVAKTPPKRAGRPSKLEAELPKAFSLEDLTTTARKLLKAIRELTAIGPDRARTHVEICETARSGHHDSQHNKDAFKRLLDRGLIASKRNVGTWLTRAGLSELDKRSTSG